MTFNENFKGGFKQRIIDEIKYWPLTLTQDQKDLYSEHISRMHILTAALEREERDVATAFLSEHSQLAKDLFSHLAGNLIPQPNRNGEYPHDEVVSFLSALEYVFPRSTFKDIWSGFIRTYKYVLGAAIIDELDK